jgi:hypothetical protein
MVHALEEVWRVLVPAGELINLRPVSSPWPVEVLINECLCRVRSTMLIAAYRKLG